MQKKILILALFGDPTLPAGIPSTGGFNQTLRELLTALAAYEIPIYVITDISDYCSEPYKQISNHIDLFRVPVTQMEHTEQENLRFAQERILMDIFSVLGEAIADIALIHSFYWFSGHLAKCIHERYHTPYIHTPISLSYNKTSTGYPPNCSFQVMCEPEFLQLADILLAITEQEETILSQHYHISTNKIIVTGRSVDMVFYNPARDCNGQPNGIGLFNTIAGVQTDAPWWISGAYTYLGRIVPIKGPAEIILAWDKLYKRHGNKTPPLWLIGGTPEQIAEFRAGLINQLAELPMYEEANKIVWWGYLDPASISAIFLKTLALITHSRFEAGGRVILEAMCQGKPVIATPNGFAADYIRDWVNGFLVSYCDREFLIRRMEHFIYQPYLANTLGNAAKTTFQQMEHDWNYVGTHVRIYNSYLHSHALPTSSEQQTGRSMQFECELTERVDVFPYCDICLADPMKSIRTVSHFPMSAAPLHIVTAPGHHARHFTTESDNHHFWIKQFYNRLNRDSIWTQAECKKVLGRHEQFKAAIQSQEFSGIIRAAHTNEVESYFILPKACVIQPGYDELCQLLNLFSKSKRPKDPSTQMRSPHYAETLESAINTLADSTQLLLTGASKKLLSYLPLVRKIEAKTKNSAWLGLNYGKPLRDHTVLLEGKLLLLPTCDWYWGEVGPDYAEAVILSGGYKQTSYNRDNSVRLLLWCFIIAWRNLLRFDWYGKKTEKFWEQIADDISTILNRLKIAITP